MPSDPRSQITELSSILWVANGLNKTQRPHIHSALFSLFHFPRKANKHNAKRDAGCGDWGTIKAELPLSMAQSSISPLDSDFMWNLDQESQSRRLANFFLDHLQATVVFMSHEFIN